MSNSSSTQQTTAHTEPMVAHIVAAAKNGVIGVDGELPWSIPEDMKWFRTRTKGRVLIMGRKTFESVEHPLPNRLNIIVTRNKGYQPRAQSTEATPIYVCSNMDEAMVYARKMAPKFQNEIFIIGGGEIYHQTVPLVDTIYLTRIYRDVKGDATYPDPDLKVFELTEKVDRSDPEPFSFLTYKRKGRARAS